VSIPRHPDILQIGSAWLALDKECRDNSIAGYILRQDTLLLHLIFWEKLEKLENDTRTLLKDLPAHVLKPPRNCDQHWFLTLAGDIYEVLGLGLSAKTFKHSVYLPTGYCNDQLVDFKYRKSKDFGDDQASKAVSLAHDCLMSWLRISDWSQSVAQAQLIRLLFDQVGVEILLHESVWNAVRYLLPGKGWARCSKPGKLTMHEWLNGQLQRAGLLDPISGIRTLIADFQRQVQAYRSEAEIERYRYLVENLCSSSTPRLIFGLSNEEEEEEEYECQPGGSKRKRSSQNRPGSGKRGKILSYADKRRRLLLNDQRSDEQRRDAWAHGISLCQLLIPSDGGPCRLPPPPSSTDAQALRDFQFQKRIMNNLDFLQPYREFGQSRQKIRSLNPALPALRTKEGFFSMCVNRAIHHNSGFLNDTDTVFFTSLEDWEQVISNAMAMKGKEWDDVYFCNPNAYSQNWSRRSLDHAQVYWNSIQSKPEYTDWLVGPTELTLPKIFRLLLKTPNDFPGMGELVMLQVLLDYCKEGVLSATIEEYAEVFARVNKAVVWGMINLGFLDPHEGTGKYSTGEIVGAIQSAEVFLNSKGLVLDYPDIEHSLCKVARHDKLRN
jgi:hypothetical protein